MSELWKIWPIGAGVIIGLYFMGMSGSSTRLLVFAAVWLLSAIVIASGAFMHDAAQKHAWLTIAAGLACYGIADIVYFFLERNAVATGGVTFPSIADVFHLAMYVLVIGGVMLLGRGHHIYKLLYSRAAGALSAVLMLVGIWLWIVRDVIDTSSSGETAVWLSYLVLGAVLVGVTVSAVVSGRLHVVTAILVAGGVGALTIADIAYNLHLVQGTFRIGLYIDFFWLVFATLLGTAALHPSVRGERAEPGRDADEAPDRLGVHSRALA